MDNIIYNGNVVKDSLGIAEAFNSYFANIGPNLADNIPTPTKPFYKFSKIRKSQSIFFLPIHETEVIDKCVECGLKRQKRAQDMAVFQNYFMNN